MTHYNFSPTPRVSKNFCICPSKTLSSDIDIWYPKVKIQLIWELFMWNLESERERERERERLSADKRRMWGIMRSAKRLFAPPESHASLEHASVPSNSTKRKAKSYKEINNKREWKVEVEIINKFGMKSVPAEETWLSIACGE